MGNNNIPCKTSSMNIFPNFEDEDSILANEETPFPNFEDEDSFRTNEEAPQANENFNNDFNPPNFSYNADDLFEIGSLDLEEDIDEPPDSIRKKLKRLVLKYSLEFINSNIKKKKYTIKKIERNQVKKTKVDFEQIFMYKTLGDIFSSKVSSKYTSIIDHENYNKIRINYLKSKDEKLRNIFNVEFIECLNHFIGKDPKETKEELVGMKTIKDVFFKDEKKKRNLINYGRNYEKQVLQSRARN